MGGRGGYNRAPVTAIIIDNLSLKLIIDNKRIYFFFLFDFFCLSPPISSAFQTDSGTACAHEGVAELGRENPAIACFIAVSSAAREREDYFKGKHVVKENNIFVV